MTHHRIVKPTIDKRFINEVPRFFGGWLPTLREIFQNAYRAGATVVNVSLDATRTILTITDNGRGCPEVEALMCIGRSDWDETKVVEAAGMGFISVLNGQLMDRVTARSADWQAKWKCQAKALAPAEVFEAEPIQGFQLVLYLKEQHDDVAGDIRKARAFYPFKVIFNDEVVEAIPVEHDLMLDTPVGWVYWQQGSYTHAALYTAVWEHRDLQSGAFADALNEAFHTKVSYPLRGVYDHYPRFTWFVDPACAVTPKLPDRNDLQDDVHLKAAAEIIAQALGDHALGLVKVYAETLPDTVERVKRLTPYVNERDVIGIMCELLGWSHVQADNFADFRVQWESCDDGPGTYPSLEFEHDYDVLARPERALVIRRTDIDTVTNWLLLNQRVLSLRVVDDKAKADIKDKVTAIKIVGRKHKAGSLVATAQRITWNGEDLPFYLNPQASLADDNAEPLIVLTGNTSQMMKTYHAHAELFRGWLLNVASEEGNLSEWCEEEYDEWSENVDLIDDTLQADILEYGSRNLRLAQQHEIAARKALQGLYAAKKALNEAGDNKVGQKTLENLLPRMKHQLEAAIKKYAAEQQRLATLIEQQTS